MHIKANPSLQNAPTKITFYLQPIGEALSTLLKNFGQWQPAPSLTIAGLRTDGRTETESSLNRLPTPSGPVRILHLASEADISLFTTHFFRDAPEKY